MRLEHTQYYGEWLELSGEDRLQLCKAADILEEAIALAEGGDQWEYLVPGDSRNPLERLQAVLQELDYLIEDGTILVEPGTNAAWAGGT